MSCSSDEDLFMSASEGEDNFDDGPIARKPEKKEIAAPKAEVLSTEAEKLVACEAAPSALEAEIVAAVAERIAVQGSFEAPEKPNTEEVKLKKCERQKSSDDEKPRKVSKVSGSTELITKQEISEISDAMESGSIKEDSSEREFGWDDFDVETEDRADDESNADGWDTWDGPEEAESAPSKNKKEKRTSEESDWFSEQLGEPKKSVKPGKKPTKSTGSMWEWGAFNDVVSAVGEGFSNVVESSFGLPSAEEMARLDKEAEKAKKANELKAPGPSETATAQHNPGASIGGLFSGIVTGGLDVLETLGKKTFETLTVKDEENASNPHRRFRFQPEGPADLSRVLKERMAADEPSDHSFAGYGSTSSEKFQGVCFQKEFDQDEGSVHLEGLRLISESHAQHHRSPALKSKFDSLLKKFQVEDSETCEAESFESELSSILSQISLPYKAPNLLSGNRNITALMDPPSEDAEDTYKNAIIVLAKFAAQSIQVFHKLSQLMLIATDLPPPETLFDLARLFCRRINFIAQHFAQLIDSSDSSEHIEDMLTTIYFEASNALHHVRSATECFRTFY
ncbi:hypothetical protein L596_014560 [Steinernema carpocapsae]|uniref:Protein FAM114A2 n=1 Tax=Steinernema carpocapsae TaxID=34508 RepID=A0A4U5ND57_STECR|nr:hypothetical protein L596_014560 [Steinernema carpocapsae]